ncbi:glucan endo-1,3-beta-glucosidase 14 [Gossypium hirsutum]|uniref:glucan endo-1,3-beta-D-glucosidase n=1 Tax=Gossypium hirsutum TaxID=3635 RepID=A0ABM3AWC3_GOSHI|nr:glucan endo-1,3-beta-glucosidase 14 [Gossypium hirsutum]
MPKNQTKCFKNPFKAVTKKNKQTKNQTRKPETSAKLQKNKSHSSHSSIVTLSTRIFMMIHVFLLLSLCFSDYGFLPVASLGINYGQVGSNLPPPDKVLDLLSSLKITKAKIYDTNPQILTTFANSNVELIVTVENQMLAVVMDPQQALQWVTTHIKPYFPATKITEISVGNEVFTDDDTSLIGYLVPAMVSIHGALVQLGLDKYIHVSTPNSLAILQESFPPSAGSFKSQVSATMSQYLQFLANTGSPFWINAYPYFAYKGAPNNVSLDYVLLNKNPGMVDPYTKLHYDNMLYAQVDAVVYAMFRLGYSGIEVRVSETGWPSKGDPDETGATPANAAVYNRNLLRRQMRNEGTPLRPNTKLEVYLFALFNEDMKPGPTSERNYGLFQPDGTIAYNVGLSALSTTSSTSSSSSSASIFLTSSADKVKS